ncbi:hypothetical protein LCGC14_2621160 [marine sediment metagenome]|uniref:Uncharacterized protein n=1 Tax=marine sediment metagenome TaxID=412755 RepID=A0A0F9AQM2_9ZZZZ
MQSTHPTWSYFPPQQFLNFRPEPQGQGSLRFGFPSGAAGDAALGGMPIPRSGKACLAPSRVLGESWATFFGGGVWLRLKYSAIRRSSGKAAAKKRLYPSQK